MNLTDAVNAGFELVAALLTWRNVLQLYRDKQVKGVYWPAWAMFAAWGLWNLYYYPHLGQWLSANRALTGPRTRATLKYAQAPCAARCGPRT
jgi:hypothetical protein